VVKRFILLKVYVSPSQISALVVSEFVGQILKLMFTIESQPNPDNKVSEIKKSPGNEVETGLPPKLKGDP
jgi:hypothetical protein